MNKTKRLKKKNRRRKRVLNIILLIGLSSLFIYFLLNSNLFEIKQIKVIGNIFLGKDEIVEVSMIHKDENIFRVRINTAEESLKKHVYIKEAKIKRNLPNVVVIDLIEREEKIQVEHISSYLIADSEGVILDQREKKDESLIMVKGINNKKDSIGDNIFEGIDDKEIENFFSLGEGMGLFVKAIEIDMESIDNVTIRLNNGLDIDFGAIDNVKYKLSLINEILNENSNNDKKYNRIILNKGTHPILVVDE